MEDVLDISCLRGEQLHKKLGIFKSQVTNPSVLAPNPGLFTQILSEIEVPWQAFPNLLKVVALASGLLQAVPDPLHLSAGQIQITETHSWCFTAGVWCLVLAVLIRSAALPPVVNRKEIPVLLASRYQFL